jgi:hypothetical protein
MIVAIKLMFARALSLATDVFLMDAPELKVKIPALQALVSDQNAPIAMPVERILRMELKTAATTIGKKSALIKITDSLNNYKNTGLILVFFV